MAVPSAMNVAGAVPVAPQEELGVPIFLIDQYLTMLSVQPIIGSRLAATPGLSGRMFAALAKEKINVDCISSSEMTMSCVIALDDIDRGVKAVHDEFFANAPAKKMEPVSRK